uniref:Uncharacterized protein n=1 Tax=Leptocylindrus danicus TaxID=163516 RepID=A0A7S2LEK1_9STRA|mmetsp:Transcript_3899/g.5661  ORF Transcript_3899/g.5661 Transcript_3899/m.5661 type:complete len:497 (+) Transcript_3899:76-1566(+)
MTTSDQRSSLFTSLILFVTASTICTAYQRQKKMSSINAASGEEFNRALALRKQHIPNAVSLSYANTSPLMILRGKGAYLFDHNNVQYLDTRNNVAHVGHCHPAVVSAVTKQCSALNTNTRYLHPFLSELAAKLIAKANPGSRSGLTKVFFVNSGSEANDLALRLVHAKTGSWNMITIEGAYHGHTNSCINISPYKYLAGKKPLGQSASVKMVPAPDLFRGEFRPNSTMSEEDCGSKYAKYVQAAANSFGHGNLGGFIMEGGMSVAGVILPSLSYMQQAVECVRSHGGLYIADEVQTGFGRFGSSYWGFQHGNDCVFPDIVTVGKPFGNGMPLAAVITTDAVAEAFDANSVEYFNTFGGNPVCASAGLAAMNVVEAENLQQNALDIGLYLKKQFISLKEDLDIIGDIRGSGLFLGVELIRDVTTLEPADVETSFVCSVLKNKFHILTSIDGPHDNVMVIKPPMVFSIANARHFVSCFRTACLLLKEQDMTTIGKTPT